MTGPEKSPGNDVPDDFSNMFPEDSLLQNPFNEAIHDALQLQHELNSIDDASDRAISREDRTKELNAKHEQLSGLPLTIVGRVYEYGFGPAAQGTFEKFTREVEINNSDMLHDDEQIVKTDRYSLSDDEHSDTSYTTITYGGFVTVEKAEDSPNRFLDVRLAAITRAVLAKAAGYGLVLQVTQLEVPLDETVDVKPSVDVEFTNPFRLETYLDYYVPDLMDAVHQAFERNEDDEPRDLNDILHELASIDLKEIAPILFDKAGELTKRLLIQYIDRLLEVTENEAERTSIHYTISSESERIVNTKDGPILQPPKKSKFDGLIGGLQFWPSDTLDKYGSQESFALIVFMGVEGSAGMRQNVYRLDDTLTVTPAKRVKIPKVDSKQWKERLIQPMLASSKTENEVSFDLAEDDEDN